MSDLISRKSVIQILEKRADELYHEGLHQMSGTLLGAIGLLDNASTIDAVEVVRCKDCKKRNKKNCPLVMIRFSPQENGNGFRTVTEQNAVPSDFYCSYGKRKDGAT